MSVNVAGITVEWPGAFAEVLQREMHNALGIEGVKQAAKELWPDLVRLDSDTPEAKMERIVFGGMRPYWIAFPPGVSEYSIPGPVTFNAPVTSWVAKRPLMTTTGYAMAWYPEHGVVVYVDDWSEA